MSSNVDFTPFDLEGFFGRSWSNVASSRNKDTVYTNTNAYPIEIAVAIDISKSTQWRQVAIRAGSLRVANWYTDGTANSRFVITLNATIPPGSDYRLESISAASTYSISRWDELR